MEKMRERVLNLISKNVGLTDREIADLLLGNSEPQQYINKLCHDLEKKKEIKRELRSDGKLGNFPIRTTSEIKPEYDKTGFPNQYETLDESSNPESSNNSLQILTHVGFKEVGYWFISQNGIDFHLEDKKNETDILYAFIANGQVMYIGKSIQSLYKRMSLYKFGNESQRTNSRNKQEIIKFLEKGISINIYAFIPCVDLKYQDISINIAASLEDNLIKKIKPEWNILS